MTLSLYEISLISAVTLMFFISSIMFFGPVPYKNERKNYILSRQTMGLAIFILALSYCVHIIFNLRENDLKHCAVFMNLSIYMLVVPLIYSSLRLLMEKEYVTEYKRNIIRQESVCIAYTMLICFLAFVLLKGLLRLVLILDAVIYCAYSAFAGISLYKIYRQLLKMADESQSDDIEQYVRWMSFIMFALILWGPACSICVFLPHKYVFIWVFMSILLYVYIFFAYKNYLLFSDTVIHIDPVSYEEDGMVEVSDETVLSDYYQQRDDYTAKMIQKWIDELGFTEQGITLEKLASYLCTNRTYLSGFLHRSQVKPFREWINDLRIDYAKMLMIESPLITMADVAEKCGYATLSHFTTTFSRNSGISPSKWIKLNYGQSESV